MGRRQATALFESLRPGDPPAVALLGSSGRVSVAAPSDRLGDISRREEGSRSGSTRLHCCCPRLLHRATRPQEDTMNRYRQYVLVAVWAALSIATVVGTA